ncbi:MAG: flagellar hook-length control protein FliK [Lamprobacter sp.]|uniref:flagellar hook-length control protein FliK n=1 Tax=Lamprobacter sp. TaxID=3100796 RepID=UPI002B25734B|nr:flagellar hook-length control protein FliK [Lamprobacter sp.]MEA3639766.1 flagellar hook-length control protein FliK [Lamprobacter sp.]
MSGINTLIDTLMHQVLGKRVDTPPPRDLNQPVKPMTPTDAPSAVRSDSRLDARHNAPVRETARAPQDERAAQARQPAGNKSAPSSTQTSFTPTARSIADLMLRFPAPSSAVRVAQPLFPTTEHPPPAQVADRLQSSVRDSGLFYESHLSRWFRGELSREQLLREPQMLRSLSFTQASSALPPTPLKTSLPAFLLGLSRVGEATAGLPQAGSSTQSAAPGTPAGASLSLGSSSGAPAAPGAAPGQGSAVGPAQPSGPAGAPVGLAGAEARDNSSAAAQQQALNLEIATQSARLRGGEVIHESLQGVVRHQLELLATPVLRWEGDVWTGIFMALMIQPPAKRDERGSSEEEQQGQEESGSNEWHSNMTLQVTGLGEVGVKLWLGEARLELELAAQDPDVRFALAEGVEQLKSRLGALGLANVQVRLHHDLPESKSEPAPESDSASASESALGSEALT